MGRRPNQLILEYFERGPKLADASNRYQHTCKSCGEKFPKGRIDSLTNHLVKKCPALPLHDRQRALLQFHELPLPENIAQHASGKGHNQAQGSQKLDLPFTPSKQLSALETLAEVSRQHLDLSGKRMPDKQQQQQQQQQHQPMQTQNHQNHAGLLEEFLIQDDRPDSSDLSGMTHSMDMSNAPALPTMYQFNGPLHHSPNNSPHMGDMPLSSSGSMAQMVPSLVMAASAANELMPLANGLTMEPELNMASNGMGMSDKFFHSQARAHWQNLQSNSLDPLLQDHNSQSLLPKDDHGSKNVNNPRPLAVNPNTSTHFTTDFSMNTKPPKPKVRGRFSDTRRKEVQEVRKRGACIRCRMLKKPCSGDNPCITCQNVESARLWKQPCIRTRIADEFSLYSAGLHSVLAYHAINNAKGQVRLPNSSTGRIEATHFLDSSTFVTFTPLKWQNAQANANSDIDPIIFGTMGAPDLELIDDGDDIGGKLDLYIKKLSNQFADAEESSFMKATMSNAASLMPPNQESLLSKAMELWSLTRILSSQNFQWQLFSNPTLAPSLAPSTLETADLEDPRRTPITVLSHPSSHELINMQLMGATEKRASLLARTVMNDLERRLLQRQQANPFETFLVAVILLACVERMCWLFRTWEVPPTTSTTMENDSTQQISTTEQDLASALQSVSTPTAADTGVAHQSSRHPRWPLDKPAEAYSQQGERFSDILNMLLKMRGVPPKSAPRNGEGILISSDTDAEVREWFESIAVTPQALDERAQARFVGNDPKEWELKYVSKIIGGD